jgi:hypothetical protein
MSTTLPTGMRLEQPDTGDKGSVWFPVLERNIVKTNDHTHNGTDAAKVVSTSITAVTQAISSAGWTNQTNGVWEQELTLPNSANYADVAIIVKSDTGTQLHLDVKAGTTTPNAGKKYKVYSNDNGLNATAHILV